jgi:uncharacterized membrane protein YjgN (DUF898 family)
MKFKARFVSLLKELFNNSLPVFVAATISRAATSILALTSEDLTTLIWVTFAYSFLIVQTIGMMVATRCDHKSPTFTYYMHVCSECAGFAWKEYVVLIMLKWLFVNKNVAMASGAWFLLVICAFIGVYIFNALLALYIKPAGHVYTSLRKFNSDAFALAISFSFTLVVASELYPSHSGHDLAGTDDIIHDPDTAIEDVDVSGWYFFTYSLFITGFMWVLQHKFGWLVEKEDDKMEEEGGSSMNVSMPEVDGYRFSFASPARHHEEGYWKSIDSVDPDSQDVLASGENPLNEGGLLREESIMMRGSAIRPTNSTTDSDSVFSTCNMYWSYIDNIIFAWDPRGYCKQSLMHLGNTVAGYTVGCAWYTYSLLTFQAEFSNSRAGEVLGLFIYSVLMTVCVTLIMSRIERTSGKQLQKKLVDFGRDSTITQDIVAKFTARYKRNNELALVAGRLVCGWSWADFITACFTSTLSDRQREFTQYKSSNWLGATVKCVVAVIIVISGLYLDEYLTKRRLNKVSNMKSSQGGDSIRPSMHSFRSPGMKLSRDEQEAKEKTERIFLGGDKFSPANLPVNVAGNGGEDQLNDALLDEDSEDEVVI